MVTPDREIEIIRSACAALDDLPEERARLRVLRFLWDRYVDHPVPLPVPLPEDQTDE